MPKSYAAYTTGLPLTLAVALAVSGSASAGQVNQITNFGNNPTGIGMYLYTPSNLPAKPAIVVGIHACHGKGTDVCNTSGSGWVTQADKYGFLLICPSAVSQDGCWDVHSTKDLTHDGGGDAAGIISMVDYVIQNKNGDASRVYAAGHSSGGMMTNVLLGSYPDVFKAGAAFAGVAFGCFAVGMVDSLGWNAGCATGMVTETGMQWGDTVRAAYPGFTGTRPRIQLWHGTMDQIVYFHNFGEEIKEWTNVLGVSATPTSTENNAIQSTWIRTRYTDAAGVVQVEAIQETGQPHNLVVDQAEAIHFFGLDGSNPLRDAGVGEAAAPPSDAGAQNDATATNDASAGGNSPDGAGSDDAGATPGGDTDSAASSGSSSGAGPTGAGGSSTGSAASGPSGSAASSHAGTSGSSGPSGTGQGGGSSGASGSGGESHDGCAMSGPAGGGSQGGRAGVAVLLAGAIAAGHRRSSRRARSRASCS